jgi:hypothetical protein
MGAMWKALPAALIGLLLGGTAYLLAAPGDEPSTPAAPVVSSAGVTTVELHAPRRPKHRHGHGRAAAHTGEVVQTPGSTHQLVDTGPAEQPATGGGGSPSGHSHRSPDKHSQPKPLQTTGPPSVGWGSDDEDESGDSDSQGDDSDSDD